MLSRRLPPDRWLVDLGGEGDTLVPPQCYPRVPLPEDLNDLSKFEQLREILVPHTVHFDYDSPVVKSSEQPHVQAVADYLKASGNRDRNV